MVKVTKKEPEKKDQLIKVEPSNGEPLKPEIIPQVDLITQKYQGASLLKITPKETKILQTVVKDEDINIRPDGLIYYPQVFCRDILNQAFGYGQWALIEHQSTPDEPHQKFYLEGSLYVRGCFVSKAIGSAGYFPSSKTFDKSDVHESAKSNCIVRCGKDLGIGKEAWQPEYVKSWLDKYAIQVWRNKTGKKKDGTPGSYQWRKKKAKPFYDEANQPQKKQPEPEKTTEKKAVWNENTVSKVPNVDQVYIKEHPLYKMTNKDLKNDIGIAIGYSSHKQLAKRYLNNFTAEPVAEIHLSKYKKSQLILIADHVKANPPEYLKAKKTDPGIDCTKRLNACKNIDDLAKEWGGMSPDEKKKHQELKEKLKKKFTTPKEDESIKDDLFEKDPCTIADLKSAPLDIFKSMLKAVGKAGVSSELKKAFNTRAESEKLGDDFQVIPF